MELNHGVNLDPVHATSEGSSGDNKRHFQAAPTRSPSCKDACISDYFFFSTPH